MAAWVPQLRKGLVELCVMAALRDGEAYGYELVQRLSQTDGMAVTESTVYPILARMAEANLVHVRKAESPNGPPRRYYRLTPLGQQRLREMLEQWHDIRTAVDGLTSGGSS
ncbi:MAG: PadR family transcriptional regulator [Phycisphaeraceae bacterium]|nr:PadR family transcriptional regulator [Phycisphaeraceae bacterium]